MQPLKSEKPVGSALTSLGNVTQCLGVSVFWSWIHTWWQKLLHKMFWDAHNKISLLLLLLDWFNFIFWRKTIRAKAEYLRGINYDWVSYAPRFTFVWVISECLYRQHPRKAKWSFRITGDYQLQFIYRCACENLAIWQSTRILFLSFIPITSRESRASLAVHLHLSLITDRFYNDLTTKMKTKQKTTEKHIGFPRTWMHIAPGSVHGPFATLPRCLSVLPLCIDGMLCVCTFITAYIAW